MASRFPDANAHLTFGDLFNQRLNPLSAPLTDHFDTTVRKIFYPTPKAQLKRHSFRCVAETYALHAPLIINMRAVRGGRRWLRSLFR